jgi:hypothetical protein
MEIDAVEESPPASPPPPALSAFAAARGAAATMDDFTRALERCVEIGTGERAGVARTEDSPAPFSPPPHPPL